MLTRCRVTFRADTKSYCWFSDDVTKIQNTKLSILLRFYFSDVLEQLKLIFIQIFASKGYLLFLIEKA